MKRLISILLVVVMLMSSIVAIIPSVAVSVGPYTNTNDCISSVEIVETRALESATYYKASVNSTWSCSS